MNQQANPSESSSKVELIVLADAVDAIKRELTGVFTAHQSVIQPWVGQLQVVSDLDECRRLMDATKTRHLMPMVFVAMSESTDGQMQSVISQLASCSEHGLVVWLHDDLDLTSASVFVDQLDNAQHVMLMPTPTQSTQWCQLFLSMAKMQRSLNQQQIAMTVVEDDEHDQKLIKQLAQANVNAACMLAELEEARDKALAADQAKGNFLANITHELRTPLSAIMGFAEILRDDLKQNPEHAQFLDCIYDNGQNLLEILDSILLMTLLDSGELEVENHPANPVAILQRVFKNYAQEAADNGLVFNLREPQNPTWPALVELDVKWVEEILNRLVHNAIKFTHKGQIDLSMNWHQNGDVQQLQFIIRDTGIGIKPQLMQSIFKPFHQADNSASRRYGGLGLGLAISQKLAHCLGGDIRVSSVPQQGSFFELLLNVCVPQVSADA
ncbi:MAG: sensor histidine kinase [Phycisphaeraceae bacterium JB051]